jgi:hypothetical protein
VNKRLWKLTAICGAIIASGSAFGMPILDGGKCSGREHSGIVSVGPAGAQGQAMMICDDSNSRSENKKTDLVKEPAATVVNPNLLREAASAQNQGLKCKSGTNLTIPGNTSIVEGCPAMGYSKESINGQHFVNIYSLSSIDDSDSENRICEYNEINSASFNGRSSPPQECSFK